jgi:hypothetical protein
MNYHVRRPCDIQLLDKGRESQDQWNKQGSIILILSIPNHRDGGGAIIASFTVGFEGKEMRVHLMK